MARLMATERALQLHDVSALSVKVEGLERDVSDMKAGVNQLAIEMRTSFITLSAQLAERSKTPWVTVSSVAAVVVTTMALIGSLALTPIQKDIATMQNEWVPRLELDKRGQALDLRLDANKETAQTEVHDLKDYMAAMFAARDKSFDRLFDDVQQLRAHVTSQPITSTLPH